MKAAEQTAATRRIGLPTARAVAAIGAVFWVWLFFGVQDTLTVFVEGQDFAAHYVMESGWSLLFLLLVATPLIGLACRPHSPVLAAAVIAVAPGSAGAGLATVTLAVTVGWIGRRVRRLPAPAGKPGHGRGVGERLRGR
jgi:hypothetical protein